MIAPKLCPPISHGASFAPKFKFNSETTETSSFLSRVDSSEKLAVSGEAPPLLVYA